MLICLDSLPFQCCSLLKCRTEYSSRYSNKNLSVQKVICNNSLQINREYWEDNVLMEYHCYWITTSYIATILVLFRDRISLVKFI